MPHFLMSIVVIGDAVGVALAWFLKGVSMDLKAMKISILSR